MPGPVEVPQIVWRAGPDLNPLNVSGRTDMQWLEALVWPEQAKRLDNLRAAIEIARAAAGKKTATGK